MVSSSTYRKAGTNFAVALEKLGKREEAIKLLTELQAKFGSDIRVFNNIGIIQKRKGDV